MLKRVRTALMIDKISANVWELPAPRMSMEVIKVPKTELKPIKPKPIKQNKAGVGAFCQFITQTTTAAMDTKMIGRAYTS